MSGNTLLNNPFKRALLCLLALVLLVVFLPIVIVIKVGEAVAVSVDIGSGCMRAVWSDRW